MALDDALHGREPDPGPRELVGGVESLERSEQLARERHVEAGAVVAQEEGARAVALLYRPELDPGDRRAARELPGVAEEVLDQRAREDRVELRGEAILDDNLDGTIGIGRGRPLRGRAKGGRKIDALAMRARSS